MEGGRPVGDDSRRRSQGRALGAVVAAALVLGAVAGFVAARGTTSDDDTFVTAADAELQTPGGFDRYAGTEGWLGTFVDAGLQPVSARTTAEGIRLVVHATDFGAADEPCAVDGRVRVGVVDGDLIDVAVLTTAPGGASFVVAGTADDRPLWIVVARDFQRVHAAFPNGATDSASSEGGLAVLAAYADPSTPLENLVTGAVQLMDAAEPGQTASREAHLENGDGGCAETAPSVPPDVGAAVPAMPAAGEPPADEASARAEIEALWRDAYDGGAPDDPALYERHGVVLDAQQRFQLEHPQYVEWSAQVYGVLEEIVFTAPDRAAVRFTLQSDNPSIPAPGVRLGEAVFIDGRWRVSIETSCDGFALAGIVCDLSLG